MLEVQRRTVADRDEKGKRGVEYRVSRRTVNQRVGITRRAFKWASSVELGPVAVHQALQTVEGLKKGRSAARESK